MNIALSGADFNLFAAYLAVLAFHFGYALYVLKRGLFSLVVGKVRSPGMILFLLLVINGFSVSCFFWGPRFWITANIGWHALLTIDEIIRTAKVSARWPFLLNHILFVGILTGKFFHG